MLTDPYFWGSVVVWVALYITVDSEINDGYDPLKEVKSLRGWEELHILLLSIPEAVLLSWILDLTGVSGVFLGDKVTLPVLGEIAIVGVTNFTVVFAVLLTIRWFIPWFRTLQEVETTKATGVIRACGIFVSILFGTGMGIAIHVGTHPSATTLQSLYQTHINFATQILRNFQAILGLQLAVLSPIISHTVSIYKNNAILALKSALFGGFGGLLYGLGIPLLLVMGMNAAIIWGVFTGLLIRNSIVAGQGILAPPIAYLSSLGLLIVGHTFHEFMGILLVGVGAGFVTLGLVKSRYETSRAGLYALGFGLIVQLGFAAFLEVWVNSQFINALKGFITIEPRIVPLQVNSSWAVSFGSVLATTLILSVVLAWMTRVTIRVSERWVQDVQ